MTTRPAARLPSLLAFARPADDLEAAASLDTDLREAHQAAALLGVANPFLSAATLLAAAGIALDGGSLPWALLDAADRVICDLRLDHGCEDWDSADWRQATVQDTAALDDLAVELRCRTRALRDERLFSARKVA
jgi:hypothetical protein